MTIKELNEKYGTNIPEILKANEVGSPENWENIGRKRIKEILQREEYGFYPEYDKASTKFAVEADATVVDPDIRTKTVAVTAGSGGREHTFRAYFFTPLGKENVPMFLYINRIEWMARCLRNGTLSQRFPLEHIIERGYGLVFIDTEEISSEMYDTGINYTKGLHEALNLDQSSDSNLGSIGLWSFAAMRVMDYMEKDCVYDSTRTAVVGHSRLGKTALLTGAFDERFAITISNNSGAGGAALFKTKEGEHTAYMINTIPYWFCNNYKKYYNAEDKMEFDQHFLLSLIAPRALYVASSVEDTWSDPNAEYQSISLAGEVYEKVYGMDSLYNEKMPELESPVIKGNVGYHIRNGKHNILRSDWMRFMDFADKVYSK